MGEVMDGVNHVWARAFSETVVEGDRDGLTFPSTILELARAYLELAPDPDADLIDEDPLPDGWDVLRVVRGVVVAENTRLKKSVFGRTYKEAMRLAWELEHDTP